MKKFSMVIASLVLLPAQNQMVTAQEAAENIVEKPAGKILYMELGGPGVIMSVNFDSRFHSDRRAGFGYRIGAGFGIGEFDGAWVEDEYHPNNGYYEQKMHTYYSFPLMVNYIFGRENRAAMFEIGAGTTILTHKRSIYNYSGNTHYGYFIGNINFIFRLQPLHTGVVFRVGFTPIIGTAGDLFPMAGISLGYVF
jgi:hypothetical protein